MKAANEIKAIIPFYKWDSNVKDIVFTYGPLELTSNLIFEYVCYGRSISEKVEQARFLKLLSNILKAKTRYEISISHRDIWNFLVKKADMDVIKVCDFKDKLSKAYKGKL